MSGYTRCACRDCGDDTPSSDISKPELCSLCQEAGCEPWTGRAPMSTWYSGQYECQRDDAYGAADYCRYCSEKISDADPCPYHDSVRS